jgi:hypothetical protein
MSPNIKDFTMSIDQLMYIIITLFFLWMAFCYTINTIRKGSTPRYHVSCKDLSDYWNRIARVERDCKRRMDLGMEKQRRGAAGGRYIWHVGNGFMDQFFLPDQEYMEVYLVRDDYPEYAIIKKQIKWAKKEFYKACRERGINRMKGEQYDKPHI